MSAKTKRRIKEYLMLFLTAGISAISLEVFLLPCGVIIGTSTGIGGILDLWITNLDSSKWYFSSGTWVFLVNIPIFIYCFVNYRKSFALKTFFYVTMLSVILLVMRMANLSAMFNNFINSGNSPDKVVYVLVGAALRGLCLPLVLSQNASTGGSDIVGLIAQRNSKNGSRGAMRAIMFVDIAVITLSAVARYFITKQGADAFNLFVYSLVAMFICELIQERIYMGFSSAVELEITTDKPVEMAQALQSELKHGTTTVKVVGGYSNQQKTMILCVVNKNQLTHARRVINKVDANAFAYVENVREVIGKGFVNKEQDLAEDKNKSTKVS